MYLSKHGMENRSLDMNYKSRSMEPHCLLLKKEVRVSTAEVIVYCALTILEFL